MLEERQRNGERLARYNASLIPLASERTRAALAAYRGGTSPPAAVLDARRNSNTGLTPHIVPGFKVSLEPNCVFVICRDLIRGIGWVDDQLAIEPQRLLPVDVVVRMTEIGSRLHSGKFVPVCPATPDRRLRHIGRTVHTKRSSDDLRRSG